MDTGKSIWLDGALVASENAVVSVVNHALHYGSGVFEGTRCYPTDRGTAVFRLQDHMQRLHYSASVLELEIPYSVEELSTATIELLRENKLESGYLRHVCMFGEEKMGLNPHGAKIRTFIAAWPWGSYLSDDPITTGISPWMRIHPKSLQADAKINGHYVNSIMASQWAHNNNFQEAILLDYEGNIAEGPGENIFLVKDNTLLTPKPGSILPGITRASVMQLAQAELGMSTREETITPEQLMSADEIFMTGTAAEVTLIKSVDGKDIGNPDMPIARQLKDLYNRVVRGQESTYEGWLTYVE